ncbi:MAG: hypothetical protein E6Q97_22600 [Desulfurellales bacterium]|nr:MAG: hypothetical protein E6Q97_22600 [Desulfurellales bacterium]
MNLPKQTTCCWMLSGIVWAPCGIPSTHYCSESGAQFCRQHAEDYEDVFGDESLKEFPIQEETKRALPDSKR